MEKRLACEANQANTARHATTLRDKSALEKKPRNESIPRKETTTSVHGTARAMHPRSMIHDSVLRMMKGSIVVRIRLRVVLFLLLLHLLLGTRIYAVEGPRPNGSMLVVATIVVEVSLHQTGLSLGDSAVCELLQSDPVGRVLLE